jgi:hypothetical protein
MAACRQAYVCVKRGYGHAEMHILFVYAVEKSYKRVCFTQIGVRATGTHKCLILHIKMHVKSGAYFWCTCMCTYKEMSTSESTHGDFLRPSILIWYPWSNECTRSRFHICTSALLKISSTESEMHAGDSGQGMCLPSWLRRIPHPSARERPSWLCRKTRLVRICSKCKDLSVIQSHSKSASMSRFCGFSKPEISFL